MTDSPDLPVDPEPRDCTHEWETCPVHNPDGGMPPFRTVVTCIYGGMETVDGTPWDENTTDTVVDRILDRLGD